MDISQWFDLESSAKPNLVWQKIQEPPTQVAILLRVERVNSGGQSKNATTIPLTVALMWRKTWKCHFV